MLTKIILLPGLKSLSKIFQIVNPVLNSDSVANLATYISYIVIVCHQKTSLSDISLSGQSVRSGPIHYSPPGIRPVCPMANPPLLWHHLATFSDFSGRNFSLKIVGNADTNAMMAFLLTRRFIYLKHMPCGLMYNDRSALIWRDNPYDQIHPWGASV